MILLPVLILIVLVLTRKVYTNSDKSIDWTFFLFMLIVGFAVSILIMIPLSFSLPTAQVPESTYTLYTLKRGDPELEGRFFLGTGYVKSNPVWEYNILLSNDPVTLDEAYVPANSDYYQIRKVLDQEPGHAYLVIYTYEFAESWFKYIALFPDDRGPTLYEFHLPTNAIIPSFEVQ